MTMSSDGSLENTILSHSPNWHSIRPWAPSLSLAVREITSVSATFILSSTLSGELDSSLASLGLEAAEDDSGHRQDGGNGPGSASMSIPRKNSSVIADALAKGLSVNVNGSAWPRAFIRIDDQVDEAVIIIYALMPGRQYDIELALASAGQPGTIRRQVTTEDDSDPDTAANTTDPESLNPDNSSSSDPHSTPSTSPSRTVPGTPPTAAPQITLEDRLNQLQHTLANANSEQESLIATLKSARRDAQKADAALRSEIETLKRTSEKNAAAEFRGKQKVLALQESVKRAHNATTEMDGTAEEMESGLPELTATKDKREAEYAKIKLEAGRLGKEREDVEEKERKRLEAMKAELAGLTNKLEKLGGKKEKLESTVIPDLEGKLSEVAGEIEAEELELARLEEEENQFMIHHEFHRSFESDQSFEVGSPSYVPMQRSRHLTAGDKPSPIGRPAPAPIQRPQVDVTLSANGSMNPSQPISNLLWSPPQSLRQSQSLAHTAHEQNQSHTPRSQSYNGLGEPTHSASVLLLGPQRRGSLKSNAAHASAPSKPSLASSSFTSYSSYPSSTPTATSSPASSSINSSPTRTSPGMSAATSSSTLSSRAPAFEPSRSMINGNNHYHGLGLANSNMTSTSSGFSPSHGALSAKRPRGVSIGNSRPSVSSSGKNGSLPYTLWGGTHGSGQLGHAGFDASR